MFAVDAHGPAPLSYLWHRDGIPLEDGPTPSGSVVSGSATTALEIAGVGPGDEGGYSCLVTNGCGSMASDPAPLRICRADLSCDGVIDFVDYLDFLNLYDSADPGADFTGDGLVDFADYLKFLNLYDAGC